MTRISFSRAVVNVFLIPSLICVLLSFPLFLGGRGNAPRERAAQKTQEKPQQKTRLDQARKPLQYEVSVTLKFIQVFAADPGGNPAADLERADFVLYDNGKLQKITDFEKHFIQT